MKAPEPTAPSSRFRPIRPLGAGGMGEVWLVEDVLRGHVAAIKRVHPHCAWLSRPTRALKREFRAVAGLRHPNIVVPLELGHDERGLYFLMEYVAGVDALSFCHGLDTCDSSPSWSGRFQVTESLSEQVGMPDSAQRQRLLERLTTTVQLAQSGAQLTLAAEDPSCAPAATRRPRPPLGREGFTRLLDLVLPQLLDALEYVHARDLVHRDIKPANVLVTAGGRVKLLDFGVLGEAGHVPPAAVAGTVAYLAPEQIQGAPPAPASDLYALGVLLFEIVTGRLPFIADTRRDLLMQHVFAAPPAVGALASHCPAELATLIQALLSKRPDSRPAPSRIRSQLSLRPAASSSAQPLHEEPEGRALLERETEQGQLSIMLNRLHEETFQLVTLGGASGAGKTALLAWLARSARSTHTVLESRNRFSERVPFNALDGLIDGLAALLEQQPELCASPAVHPHLEVAGHSFPVLHEHCTGRLEVAPTHPAQVHDAVCQLWAAVASPQRPLVLMCDDLQWADSDSVALLARLLLTRPPHIAVVAGVREDRHSEAFERFWASAEPDLHLPLAGLSPAAARRLAAVVAGRPERELPELPLVSQGNPFFATLFGRMWSKKVDASSMDDPLNHVLTPLLSGEAGLRRRLLALICVSEGATSLGQLTELTDASAGQVDQALDPLIFSHLLRANGPLDAHRHYDCEHDLVRRALANVLTAAELRSAHEQLARYLQRHGAAAALRVRHLAGAGQVVEAARLSVVGAEEAERAQAYGLAAELYAIALLADENARAPELYGRRAQALEMSGRYVQAAESWGALAKRCSGTQLADAQLNQAKALLATTHLHEGHAALRRARPMEAPTAGREKLATALAVARFLVGPRSSTHRRTRAVSRSTPARDAFLGTMRGYFDPPAGIQHLLLARDGYARTSSWADASEVDYVLAYIAYFGTAKHRRTRLASSYLARARRTAGGVPRPEQGRIYALDQMVSGVRAQHHGQWDEATRCLDASIAQCEQTGERGSFGHQFAWVQRLQVDRHRQHVATLARTLEAFRRVASEVEDSALTIHLRLHEVVYDLMQGRAERAHERAAGALASWPKEPPTYQRYLARFYACLPYVYSGDAAEALHEMRASLHEHARFLPTRTMFAGDVAGLDALLQAHALRAGSASASLRSIERLARAAASYAPLGRHMALRAAAYACEGATKRGRARRWLEQAEKLAREAQQPIDVAIARYQRGRLIGGAAGQALGRDAERQLRDCGADPLLFDENPWGR